MKGHRENGRVTSRCGRGRGVGSCRRRWSNGIGRDSVGVDEELRPGGEGGREGEMPKRKRGCVSRISE